MSAYAQEYGYFFNSNNDRTYNAESFETWLKPFFVSGVMAGCLQVKAQTTPDMTVSVTSGYANLNGKPAYWPNSNTMTLSMASGVYPRIDTIVLRRDNANRCISIEVVTGTASSSPHATAPMRTSEIFELVLAEVYVGVGVTSVTQACITDKRPDTSVCGYVMCTIETPDFSELYAQFEQQADDAIAAEEYDLANWFTVNTETFAAWFDAIKDQLDEDAAGHLQLEIDDLQEALVIVATGDIHAAIGAGKFVYIKDHGTLGDGLYTANSTINENDPLTSSNVTAVSGGGLNKLVDKDNKLTQTVGVHEGAMAIVCNGDVHPTIHASQYVYVKNNTHGLTEGMYVNTSGTTRYANSQVTSSYFSPVEDGGLNSLETSIHDVDTFSLSDIFTSFQTGMVFDSTNSVVKKKGNRMMVLLVPDSTMSKQTTTSAAGNITVGTLKTDYRPIVTARNACIINKSTSGNLVEPCALTINSSNGIITIGTGLGSTQIGSSTDYWCTNSGIALEWTI